LADCGLALAVCGFTWADYGLAWAVCGFTWAICGFTWGVYGLVTHDEETAAYTTKYKEYSILDHHLVLRD
jgi:hypothetical protein